MDALRPLLTAMTLPELNRLRQQLETDLRQLRLPGFAPGKRQWLRWVNAEIATRALTDDVGRPVVSETGRP
jgi:hypothetical protein